MNRTSIHTGFALLAATVFTAAAAPSARAEPVTILAAAGTPTALAPAALGGSISATVAGLSVASLQAQPGFPLAAWRDGHREGTVRLAYTVQPDGSVSDVRVLRAVPMHAFTRSAVNMIAAWRFVPAIAPQSRVVEVNYTTAQ